MLITSFKDLTERGLVEHLCADHCLGSLQVVLLLLSSLTIRDTGIRFGLLQKFGDDLRLLV
jgi:hypothetical protein